ncbi:hypothetical protein INR49_025512 [Caranx melampygus]|nr:hypothetical protein INR49_025512 [Caranx melampygus]
MLQDHDIKTATNCMRMDRLVIYTHNAMRPSEARLNTTLPKAATPALWPCEREEIVRGSRLPTRPVDTPAAVSLSPEAPPSLGRALPLGCSRRAQSQTSPHTGIEWSGRPICDIQLDSLSGHVHALQHLFAMADSS